MSELYRDLLQGFKEIGELEGNSELVAEAEKYIEEKNYHDQVASSTSIRKKVVCKPSYKKE